MATICNRAGVWRVSFCIDGKRTSKSVRLPTREQVENWSMGEESRLRDFYQKPGADISESYAMRVMSKARGRAVERGIDFLITKDDMRAMLLRSGGKCEVTKIPFDNNYRPAGSRARPYAVSIDRIDSGKPYTPDNCRLVCVAVNYALGEWGMPILMQISKAICMSATKI